MLDGNRTNRTQDTYRTDTHRTKGSQAFLVVFFLLGIAALGLFNAFFHTNEKVSSEEFRALQQHPTFSVQSYWSGDYAKEMDQFLSDQFFVRALALETGKCFQSLLGLGNITIRTEGVPIYYDAEGDYCFSAYQHHPERLQNYAHALETCAKLHPNIRFYCMAVPTSAAFVSAESAKLTDDPRLGIEQLEAFFDASPQGVTGQSAQPGTIRFIPIYDAMKPYNVRDLYFRTDHHWNGTGSYLGYQAFCDAAGLASLPKSALGSYEIQGFLGSHYRMTQNQHLKQNPDTILAYKPRTSVVLHRYALTAEGAEALKGILPTEAMPPEEFLITLDPVSYAVDPRLMGMTPSYGIYLGGDYGLCVIESSANQGKGNILVFKDSMGNAVAPLLADHYHKVYIVDPRHWYGALSKFTEENDIDTVLFLNIYNTSLERTTELVKRFWGQ